MLLNDFSDEQLFCSFIAEEQERNRAIANMIGIKTAVDFFKNCGIACSTKTSLHKIKKVFQETDIADIYIGNLRLDVRLSLDPNEFYIPKKHYELGITPDLYMLVYYDKGASKASVVGFIAPKEVDKSASDNYYYFVSKSVIASFEETAQLFDTAPSTESEVPLNIKKRILLYIDNQLSDKNGFYQEIASSKKARELFIEALYAEKLLSATEFKFEYSEEAINTTVTSGKEELYDLGFADGLMASELTASIVEADKSETNENTDEISSDTIDLEDFIEDSPDETPVNSEENATETQDIVEEQATLEEVQESVSKPEPVVEPVEEVVEKAAAEEEIKNDIIESTEEPVAEAETIDSTEFDLDNFTDDESEETTIEVPEELQVIESPKADTVIEMVETIEPETESSDIEISEESNDEIHDTENSLELDTEFSFAEDISTENDVTEELQLVETVPANTDLDIETSSGEEELKFSLSIEEPVAESPEEVQEEEETSLDLINEEDVVQIEVEEEALSLDSTEEPLDVTPLGDSINFPEEDITDEIATLDSTEDNTVIAENESFAFAQEEELTSTEDFSLEEDEPIALEDTDETGLEISEELNLDEPQELSFESLEEEEDDGLLQDSAPADLELGFEDEDALFEEEPIGLEDSIEDIGLEEVGDIELEEPALDFAQETVPTTLEDDEDNNGLSFKEFAEDVKVIDENSTTLENTSQDEEDDEEDDENRFDKYDNLDANYVPDFASGEFSLVGSTPEPEETIEEMEISEANTVEPLDIQATMEGFVNSMAPEDSLNIVNEPEQIDTEENSELQIIAENDDSLIEAIAEDVVEDEPEAPEEQQTEPVIESGTIEAIDSLYEDEVTVEEEAPTSTPHRKTAQKSNGLSFIVVLLSIVALSAAAWFNKDIILDKLGGFSQSSTDTIPNELATPTEAKNTQVKEQKHKVKAPKKTEAEELLNDVEEPVQLIDTSVSVSQLSIDCDVPSALVTTYSKRYLIKLAKRTQLQLRNALLLANGQPLANKIVIDLSISNDIVKFEKISSSSGSKKVDAITKTTIEEILKDTQPHLGTFGKIGGNVRLIVKF